MKARALSAIFSFFLFLSTTHIVHAATYYIDCAGGTDANSGTSMSSPWLHHPYMTGWKGSYTHSPGDRFIFKGGTTCPNGYFPMSIQAGGSSSSNADYYGVNTSWSTGTPSGVVNTNGSQVILVSGTPFDANPSDWTGTITVNGSSYTISHVQDAATLWLTTSAGTQSNVSYSLSGGFVQPQFNLNNTVVPGSTYGGKVIAGNGNNYVEFDRIEITKYYFTTPGAGSFGNSVIVDSGSTSGWTFNGFVIDNWSHSAPPCPTAGTCDVVPGITLGDSYTVTYSTFSPGCWPGVSTTCADSGSEGMLYAGSGGNISYSSCYNSNGCWLNNGSLPKITHDTTVAYVSPNPQGYVNTSNGSIGSCPSDCVQWVSGTLFAGSAWVTGTDVCANVPCTITINGSNYTLSAYYSDTLMAVSAAPGNQTDVPFTVLNATSEYDAGSGAPHPDAVQVFGSYLTFYNNVIHDVNMPGNAGAFILEWSSCDGSTNYVFNNIIWNVGAQDSIVYGTSACSSSGTSDASYIWNNTVIPQPGGSCIVSYGGASYNVVDLLNNHCISTTSSFENTKGSTYNTHVNTPNILMSPSVAFTQGYISSPSGGPCASTPLAPCSPTASSNSTIGAGTNLTSTSPGCGTNGLSSLCSATDLAALVASPNARPNSGTWNAGAYEYNANDPPPNPPTSLSATVQ